MISWKLLQVLCSLQDTIYKVYDSIYVYYTLNEFLETFKLKAS